MILTTLTLISSLGDSVSSKVIASLWKLYPPSIDNGIMADATIKHPKATRDKNSGCDARTTNDFRLCIIQATAVTVARACITKRQYPIIFASSFMLL